jgi:ABC-2 type transport system ATP-binding protein
MRVHHVEVQFAGPVPVTELRGLNLDDFQAADDRASFLIRGSFEPLMQALAGNRVVNFVSHEPSLEDVFLSFYGDGAPS